MDQKLREKLAQRKAAGTLRSLVSFTEKVDFFSNDYLGLAREQGTTASGQFGGTGSRLISGNTPQAEDCEAFLAKHFDAEAALVFNSGYNANLGLFASIPQRGDTVIYDEHIHASIRDGIRLSFANAHAFQHNSLIDLARKIKQATGTIYVAVESLYSMQGDSAPLLEIAAHCTQVGAYLIVDEAHSAGVFGEGGKGMVHALNLQQSVFARIVTFGKAYGAHGACVIGSIQLKDFLINFARSFIYTTALPPSDYERIQYMVARNSYAQRETLNQHISLFRKLTLGNKLISDSSSPIQMLHIGSVEKSINLAQTLQEANFAVRAILPPTIKKGNESIRICLHAFNQQAEITQLARQLNQFMEAENR